MSKHRIAQGECIAGIARLYGFRNWRSIYDAPENESFRELRPNPNVVYPGDEIEIPATGRRTESCKTDATHRFALKSQKWRLRLQMRDEAFGPLPDVPFKLLVEGEVIREDVTDADGFLDVEVEADAKTGTLEILGESIELKIGHLDPVSRRTGVQQRLRNLGYYAGAIDGIFGPATAAAVAAFQQSTEGLEVTGQVDEDTRKELLRRHDDDDGAGAAEESMDITSAEAETSEDPFGGEAGPGGADEPAAPAVLSDLHLGLDPGTMPSLDSDSESEVVRGVQARLLAIGFDPGPVDGIAGPLTAEAVRSFQERCRRDANTVVYIIDSGPVDGIIGPLTIAAVRHWAGG